MRAEVYWVDGPWPGKLGLAARPRGGEWLADEIASLQQAGVDTVLSLLTSEEEHDLELENEAREAKTRGIDFESFPIPDRQVPASETEMARTLEKLDAKLTSGKNVVVHCRQGVGRTGLVAACLLLTKGLDSETAIRRISAARGVPVPETTEQRRWIDRFSTTLTGTR